MPRSSPRSVRDSFLKILSSVDPDAIDGFGFHGVIMRPGAVVTPAQLRPSPAFPELAIALEYAYAQPAAPQRRREPLYILWRWDGAVWRELGRAASESWHWAIDLRPLALRALREARPQTALVKAVDLHAVGARIAELLDRELRPLDAPDRRKVAALLHDQLASRLVA